MECYKFTQTAKKYHKTPSHRDLLPDLTNMYVSGKVIEVEILQILKTTGFPSKAPICSQTLQNGCVWEGGFGGILINSRKSQN